MLNSDHPVVSKLNAELKEQTAEQLKPVEAELKGLRARQAALKDERDKEKGHDASTDTPSTEGYDVKKDLEQTESDIKAQEDKKQEILANFAKGEEKVRHLIDLALLQNGLLKGKDLTDFVKRAVSLL